MSSATMNATDARPNPGTGRGRDSVRDKYLPFSLPDLDGSELGLVAEVLESHWITTEPSRAGSSANSLNGSALLMPWP